MVDKTLSFDEIQRIATGADNQLIIIEVDREDSAAESVTKFSRAINTLTTPGNSIGEFVTPVDGGLLKMDNVGVVLRHPSGKRAKCGCPRRDCLPSLHFTPRSPDVLYATLGPHVAKKQIMVM